jgi:hypothetical protein
MESNLEITKFVILSILTVGSVYLAFKADNHNSKTKLHKH